MEKINVLEKITHHSFDWMNNIYGFLSMGSMVWMVVFAIIYVVYKKRYKYLMTFLPVIGIWGPLMVDPRYIVNAVIFWRCRFACLFCLLPYGGRMVM